MIRLRVLIVGVLTGLTSGAVCGAPLTAADQVVSNESYMRHVRYLASDELGGRGNGKYTCNQMNQP